MSACMLGEGSREFHRVPSGPKSASGVVKRVSVRSKSRSWAADERRRHNSDLAVPDEGGNQTDEGGNQTDERRRHNTDLAVPDEGGHPITIRGTISQMREAIRLMREAISLVREAIREPSGGHQRVSREQSAALS